MIADRDVAGLEPASLCPEGARHAPRGGSLNRRRRSIRILRPIQEFVGTQAASGIVLLLAALAALVWANSRWAAVQAELLHHPFTIGFEGFALSKPVHHWINDGLMAIFFFLVGLEIKREFVNGELASPRRALLPIAAAAGGMVVPALLYTLFNAGGPGAPGWGIPMATDIAFALGCAALLGRRVPPSLIVFLTALAIVDDLGAVLVIALFYTHGLAWDMLGLAALVMVALIGLNLLDVRKPASYLVLGLVLWVALLESGVHATIAGVLLGMVIPANTRASLEDMLDETEGLVAQSRNALASAADEDQRKSIKDDTILTLDELADAIEAPAGVLEHVLHPWVSFLIMPLFALANAGVALSLAELSSAITHPVTLGVVVGLVAGKPLGIMGACLLVVRLGLSSLPTGTTWRHLIGVSMLAGIGFTMSLFISGLAFADAAVETQARVGILAASLLAGIAGSLWLVSTARRAAGDGVV
jgi:NhaA family Na+:H+ antiporter